MKLISFRRICTLSLMPFLVTALLSITALAFGEDHETLFFASDVHDNTSRLNTLLTNCGGSYEVVGLAGDHTDTSFSSIQTIITGFGAKPILSQGNNDSLYTHSTGAVTDLADNEYYDIYVINWNDFPSVNAALDNYLNNYKNGKVIFVMSHAPLHSTRSDINQAAANAIFETLQDHGLTLDIVFLWGHNHYPAFDAGINKVVVPGETIWNGTTPNTYINANASTPLNFTCLNAGYVNADNSATIITVDSSEININRCGSSGSGQVDRKVGSSFVLLLDRSGSMSWNPDGVSGVPEDQQRITLAKNAIYPFLEMAMDFNVENLKFGITQFPQSPTPPNLNLCAGQNLTQALLPFTEANKNTAINITIPGITTDDNTPLLDGIQKASELFELEPDRVIVLLSDGYHNCPHFVSVGDTAVNDLIAGLNEKSIHVFSIGFGKPSDPDHLLLRTLAEQTTPPGVAVTTQFFDVTGSPDPATGLDAVYAAILADALHLELHDDPLGTIIGGKKITKDISINKLDKCVSFYVSWATQQNSRLNVTVISSDSKIVPIREQGVKYHKGKTYVIITVDKAFLNKPGKVGATPWKLVIDAGKLKANEEEKYQYSVVMDSMLKMEAGFNKVSYNTGNSMILSAKLTQGRGKKPVKGLKDVWVEITRPSEGIGNWLSVNKVSASEQKEFTTKRGTEYLTPVQQKLLYLTEKKKIPLPGFMSPLKIQLFDNGTHGDKKSGDGIYTNTFKETVKEGVYSFSFTATGTAGGGEKFKRHEVKQKYVAVNVDPSQTLINVVKGKINIDRSTQMKINITPKDSYKNYLGPRYATAIKLESRTGKFLDSLKDNLDGSYTQMLQVPAEINPKQIIINVSINKKIISFSLGEKMR